MLVIAKKPCKRMAVFVAALLTAAVFQALVPAGTASAEPVAGIYSVDMAFLIAHHPDSAAAGQAIKDAAAEAEKEFTEKAANMNDKEKMVLYNQIQSRLDAKGLALTAAIQAKVRAAVQEYAVQKGLPLVIEKSVTIVGGEDITAEVGKKILGQ